MSPELAQERMHKVGWGIWGLQKFVEEGQLEALVELMAAGVMVTAQVEAEAVMEEERVNACLFHLLWKKKCKRSLDALTFETCAETLGLC